MAGYPGGSDLALTDAVGAELSLVWGRGPDGEPNAEIAIDDGYEHQWANLTLDRDQLVKLAAHIINGLSPTGETVDRIIRALEAA